MASLPVSCQLVVKETIFSRSWVKLHAGTIDKPKFVRKDQLVYCDFKTTCLSQQDLRGSIPRRVAFTWMVPGTSTQPDPRGTNLCQKLALAKYTTNNARSGFQLAVLPRSPFFLIFT